jgi:hypothetical protein
MGVLGMSGSCEEQKTDEQGTGFHGCLLSLPPTIEQRVGALRIREGAAGAVLTLLSIGRKGRTRRFIGFGDHESTIDLDWMGEEMERRATEGAEKRVGGRDYREKKKAGLVNARLRNAGGTELGRSALRPYYGKPATRIFRS